MPRNFGAHIFVMVENFQQTLRSFTLPFAFKTHGFFTLTTSRKDNVVIDETHHALLTDFGLSKVSLKRAQMEQFLELERELRDIDYNYHVIILYIHK